jgi:hypothetical protein
MSTAIHQQRSGLPSESQVNALAFAALSMAGIRRFLLTVVTLGVLHAIAVQTVDPAATSTGAP